MHLRCVGRGLTALGVLGVVSIPIAAAFVALALSGGGAWESEALAGTQQCNTVCQTQMTDCILSCDGVVSCELACKRGAVDCVSTCSSDAGTPMTSPVDGSSEAFSAHDARLDASRSRDAAREGLAADAQRARARDQ